MNEIKNIPISKIETNKGQIEGLPKNPRFIKDYRFEALKKSIEQAPEMLALRELIVYPFNGKFVVVCGNMRLRACKELGFDDVPCKVLPADTPTKKLREIAIKDNTPFGSDDFDILANEWDEGELVEWGMELPQDWESVNETEPAEIEEVDVPEDVETRCQKGDIWILGDHRLMCGDSTDAASVALLMDGQKADMVFTDPPYNVSYADKNEFLNAAGAGHRLTRRIENDSFSTDEEVAEKVWLPAFTNMAQSANNQCSIYVTMPQGGAHMMMMMMMIQKGGWQVKHELIWNKNNHVLGRCDYNYKHEPILYGWKEGGTHKFYGKSGFSTSVWDIPKPLNSDLHPTMKPVELIVACLKDASKEGDKVIDLFGGSGTTILACEQTGRKCYTMELDPHYCDVILTRWEKLTGKTAEKC